MATKLSKIGIVVSADSSDAEKKLQSSLDGVMAFTAVSAALQVANAAFRAAGAGIDIAASAVGRFVDAVGRLGDLKDAASKLEIDPNELISLKRSARLSGSNQEAIENLIGGMRNKIGEAISGGTDVFAPLGLSAQSLSGMGGLEQLTAIGSKLSEIKNLSLRQKLGEDVFGKNYRQNSAMILSDLQAINEETKKLGLTYDQDVITNLDKTGDILGDVYEQYTAIGDKLIAGIEPAVRTIADITSDWLADLNTSGNLDLLVAGISTAAKMIAGAFVGVRVGLELVIKKVNEFLQNPLVQKFAGGFLEGATGDKGLKALGFASPVDILGQFGDGVEQELKDMKARRAAAAAELENQKLANRKRAEAEAIVNKAFNWLSQGAAGLLKAVSEDPAKALKAMTVRGGAPGALEVGTAAAYAASNPQQQMVKEQQKGNDLIKQVAKWTQKAAEKLEGWNFVPVNG